MNYNIGSNVIIFIDVDAYHGPTKQMEMIATKAGEKFKLGKFEWIGNNDRRELAAKFENDIEFEEECELFGSFISLLINEE